MNLFELLAEDDPSVDLGAAAPFRSCYHGHRSGSEKLWLASSSADLVAAHLRVANRAGPLGTPTAGYGHVPALRELRDVAVDVWRRDEPFLMFLPHALTLIAALAASEATLLERAPGASSADKVAAVDAAHPGLLAGLPRLRKQVRGLRFETPSGQRIGL